MYKVSNYIMPDDTMSRGSMRFEDDLRKIRLSRGLDFDSIYKKTKIRPEVIDRLETTGLADDPVFSTDIYKRPLIRNYAHGLGIDPEEVLRAFDLSENGEYDGFLGKKYIDPNWKPEPKKVAKADVSDVMDKWYPTTSTVGAALGSDKIAKTTSKKSIQEPPAAIQQKKVQKVVELAPTEMSNEADKQPSKSEKKPSPKAKKATHDHPSAPPVDKIESKPKHRVMDKKDRSLKESHESLKPNPRKKESPHLAPELEDQTPKKSKLKYLIPIAAVIAGITIGGIFGPGLIAKFAEKQPVTIKYSQAASFDEMPSLMKGVVETGDNEKTFVIVALRKNTGGRNDQFQYTLRTTTNGQLYSVNGMGQISPDRNRISIGDYGWGSIKKAPDGQFAIISVNETDYPKWELTGK